MTTLPTGHSGRLLHLDLGAGRSHVEEPTAQEWRRYPGGGLLGVRRLLTDTAAGLDPFAPASVLMLMSGVVAGHRAVGLPAFTVVGKSPLTGGVGEARGRGPFGAALKASGCDGVLVTGRAAAPCYVVIEGGALRLQDAADLWGLETHCATDVLKARHGDDAAVAVIGPAGENLVRYAGIVTEFTHAAARMGLGAVMGAKNLKAVVVVPGAMPAAHDDATLQRLTALYRDHIGANPLTAAQASATGFGGWFLDPGLTGYAGVGNFQTAAMPSVPAEATQLLADRRRDGSGACPGCPNDCITSYDNGIDPRLGGLDEENLAAFVLGCGVTDVGDALDLVARCHAVGLDPVSFAAVWAYLTEVDRAERPPAAMIDDVTARHGDDWFLGEGVRLLAEARGRPEPAMHVKGVEFCRYDPRTSAGQALAYAVSPLGPRYEIVEHDLDFDPDDGPAHGLAQMRTLGVDEWADMTHLDAARVARTAVLLDLWSGLDALGVCLFAGPPMRLLTQARVAEIVAAVTGWLTSDHEIMLWGRRRWNLMRLYNIREGIGAERDTLPERFFTEPVDSGRHAGAVLDRDAFSDALAQYYALAGWDAEGVPTSITLASLGLQWADPRPTRPRVSPTSPPPTPSSVTPCAIT